MTAPTNDKPAPAEEPGTERYRQIALRLNDSTLNREPVSVNQVRQIARALHVASQEETTAVAGAVLDGTLDIRDALAAMRADWPEEDAPHV